MRSTLVRRLGALCDQDSQHDQLDFPEVAFRQNGRTGSGAHPSSYPMSTVGALPPRVKRPGREVD
jgi:hypothetical protein